MAAASRTGPLARLVALVVAWWRAFWTGPAPRVRWVAARWGSSYVRPPFGLEPDPPKRRRPCRRAQVLAVLRELERPLTAEDLVVLMPTTRKSARAHLRRLERRGEVVRVGKAWRATAAEAARR